VTRSFAVVGYIYANNAVHPRRRGETSKSGKKKKQKKRY